MIDTPLLGREIKSMQHQPKKTYISLVLFAFATTIFLAFYIFLDYFEGMDIYRARESRAYHALDGYTLEQVEDDTAPAGIRHVYRWNQAVETTNDTCLSILTVHQAVEVYFDGELVYSMEPSAANRLADSTGTCWNTVPLYPSDDGTQITVIVTPMYDTVADFGAEIWYGSQFSLYYERLIGEIPEMLISLLCIVLGVFIILVQMYYSLVANTQAWDMFFLGSFAILLGLWRLTYAYSITILFPEDPMAMGYLCIGALFLVPIPLAMFAGSFLRDSRPLVFLSCASSVVVIAVLLAQIFGAVEMRELLSVCHADLVVTIAVIFVCLWRERKARRQDQKGKKLFALMGVGVVLDVISFNLAETSSSVMFTLLAFILYAIIVFIGRATDVSRSAYTDSRTGLGNRLRWNELMQSGKPEGCGIVVMDLNGLKRINDTLGHEAGDRVIFRFSNILRNTLPNSSIICRWGGDEFAALLVGVGRRDLDQQLDALEAAVDAYNGNHPELPIHYAVGGALAAEHPGASYDELFHLADAQMYRNKRIWYAQKQSVM